MKKLPRILALLFKIIKKFSYFFTNSKNGNNKSLDSFNKKRNFKSEFDLQ